MIKGKSNLISALVELTLLTICVIAIPIIIEWDIELFLQGNSEVSITELTQETLILLSSFVFAVSAFKEPRSRSWLVLVSALFACMFIREIDFWLDYVTHGFWLYPAVLTGFSAFFYAVRNVGDLFGAVGKFTSTKSYVYIAIGLLVVLFFSRLFGTGSLWQGVMGENYLPAYKTLIQEGLELFGYCLIALGSANYFYQADRTRLRPNL